MPELPEVEVARRGIASQVTGRTVTDVAVREARLRWRVEPAVRRAIGREVRAVRRRGKYLVFDCGEGALIVHLGMSGSLRMLPADVPPARHEHVDFVFGDQLLRLRDPRRFGAVLWCDGPAEHHPLLARLGREPLSPAFGAAQLHRLSRGRRAPIKQFLMDARHIVGIGNIYASESLFRAGIHPRTAAQRLSAARCTTLARAVKDTLRAAIRAGGSSLRDFVASDGHLGCFQTRCFVYDRAGEPCKHCGATIRRSVQGQRATYYCPRCQR